MTVNDKALENVYIIDKNGNKRRIKRMYIGVNGAFENVGTTSIDLSGYVQKSELHALTNEAILNNYNEDTAN